MGAGQSITIEAATAAQKEKVGRFELRTSEEHTLIVLNDILNQMLTENNLFDLSQLLGSNEGCSKLFTVLSSTVKKEFMSLRLPDPMRTSEARMVSAIMKDKYAKLENDNERQLVCDNITRFIVRLVTLVAALTSSVAINRDLPALLSGTSLTVSERPINKRYKNPKIQIAGRVAINGEIIKALSSNEGILKQVMYNNEKPDERELYYFGAEDSVVIDVKRSIVYMPIGSSTGVLAISIEPRETAAIAPGYAYANRIYYENPSIPHIAIPRPQMAMQRPQQPMPRNNITRRNIERESTIGPTGINTISTSTRTNATRGTNIMFGRGRRTRRARRRQTGGAEPIYFVRVSNIVDCTDTCQTNEFYMNNKGYTIDKSEYESRSPITQGMPFADRISRLISKYPKTTLEDATDSVLFTDKYDMVHHRDPKAYERLLSIQNGIESKMQGVSPAAYRAFLLASELSGETLNTLFCTDAWANQRTTHTVSYALLNSLYKDRYGAKPEDVSSESTTARECTVAVNKFIGDKLLGQYTPSGANVDTFENAKFLKYPSSVNTFCGKVPSTYGKRSTTENRQIQILKSAHKKLRELYDVQIVKVRDTILRVLTAKQKGYRTAPYLDLNPIFRNHESGALVALEEIIADARKMLSDHYYEVEKVYHNAMNALGSLMIGNIATPTTEAEEPQSLL